MSIAPDFIRMRKSCRCGSDVGRIETKNGQDCVRCLECDSFQYNAPKTETGRAPRSVTTNRDGIKPGQRARILERDNGCCVLCHANNVNLHVGHLLSYSEGKKQGLTDEQLNDDENLAAMCDECNLGLSDRPVSIRLLMAVLIARLGWNAK
jgi:hypothetical protein